jgi:hypothetical protein
MKERKVYMAKRDTSWTMAKYKRFLSENRGAGQLASYKPWLSIQDFPSKGRVSRIKGWKTNRIHHLLLCEFERYDNSRLKNRKLEEKIQNLLIAYHQLGGNIPLILFVYWTYPKVTPGDISNYIRIFDEGFTDG